MKITIPLAGVLALAAFATAQQDPKPPEQDAKARLQSLQKEVDAAIAAWREETKRIVEETRKAQEEGRTATIPALQMRPDLTPLIAKFQAAATDYAGTDDAVPFLTWIVQNGGGVTSADAKDAIARLTEDHAASPAIAEFVTRIEYLPGLVGPEAAQRFMGAVKSENEDPNVLGWVALGELGPRFDEAASDSDAYAETKKALLAHAERATDTALQNEIRSRIDLREKFGVGATAPDIAGIDLDGEAFRLSDYEGKVIFLDFWGDW